MNGIEILSTSREFNEPPVFRLEYESAVDRLRDWALVEPSGHGTLWLVNLHGHGSNGNQLYLRPDIRDHWLPLFRRLSLSILAPNLRDNAWMSPAAVADLHALLARVRAEYGAERFLFVGGSMGGTGALIYSIRHPEDVHGVCALCPATDLALEHQFCRSVSGPVFREIAEAIEVACGGVPLLQGLGSLGTAKRSVDGRELAGKAGGHASEALRNACAALPEAGPEVYAAHSARSHAHRLTMPVHLAHGTADATIPVEHTRALAVALQGHASFTCREIEGGDHEAPLLSGGMEEWLTRRVADV